MAEIWRGTRIFAERKYLVLGDASVTYGAAHAIVDAVSAWLVGHGVTRGDRIGIAMRNVPEWLLIFWAATQIGAVVVGFNAWWTAEEAEHGIAISRPKVLFCDTERLTRLRPASVAHAMPVVVIGHGSGADHIAWDDVVATPPAKRDASGLLPEDIALVFFTSGTTGRAKGARLTHRGCINAMMNIAFNTAVTREIESILARGPGADPAAIGVALVATPLFHVTAHPCLTLPITAAGGTLVLMHKWDAAAAAALVARERVTVMYGVPTQVRELVRVGQGGGHDLSSLAVLSGGGASMQPDLVQQVVDLDQPVLPSTGYGMTETCGAITALTGSLYARFPRSVGRALPTTQIRIVDSRGHEAEPGERGELWVRGVCVIDGYIGDDHATSHAIEDGWLKTGDVATIDRQGFIEIVDRIKDMIIRGGENVYCAEVEAALYRVPGVIECCAFGVPDARLGEQVGAAVVFARGAARVPASDVRDLLRSMIAQHKIPRFLWTVEPPLPRNASGKLVRNMVQAMLDPATAE